MTPDASPPIEFPARERAAVGVLRTLQWTLGALAIASICGAVVSMLPPRARLIGIAAVVIGAGTGWLAGRISGPLRFHYPPRAMVAGTCVGAAVFVLTSVLWWRGYAEQVRAAAKTPAPGLAMAMRMLPAETPAPGVEGDASAEEFRSAVLAAAAGPDERFTGYLTHRVSAFAPGPIAGWIIWCVEVLLSGIAAGWMASRSAAALFCTECQSWLRVVRDQQFSGAVPDEIIARLPGELRPDVASVGVTLQTCACPDRQPLVHFDVATKRQASSHLRADIDDDQVRVLQQLIDEAQNLK